MAFFLTTMGPQTLIRLLTWLSPAFPTGAFAYSHGVEWAVECRAITDRAQLADWLTALLLHGSLWSDAILLRHAWRAQNEQDLRRLADQGVACASSRERQHETVTQGAAFARAIAVWGQLPACLRDIEAADRWPLPVVMGATLRIGGIGEEEACMAAGQASLANLVSAAVRLIPLGQTDGLRCMAALEPAVLEMTRRSASADLNMLGGCCLMSDIAAMRHETQRTRLFRT